MVNIRNRIKEVESAINRLENLSLSLRQVGLNAASEKIEESIALINKALESIKKEFDELNQNRYNDAWHHFGSVSSFILNPKFGEMVNSAGLKKEVIKRIKWHSEKSDGFKGSRWNGCRHRDTHISKVDFDNFDGSEEELINLLENIIIRYNRQRG